jgi:orotidine-5'-phosphate decarboxylase
MEKGAGLVDIFGGRYGIIPACDVADLDSFKRVVDETSTVPGVVAYKLGCVLGLSYGLPMLMRVAAEHTNLPIIYDHQKASTDIPELGGEFANVCRSAGIRAAILFPQSGPETFSAFVAALLDRGVTPVVGGEMTHPSYLASEGGFILDDAPARMYELGARLGVAHFVVPGNKPDMIGRYVQLLSETVGEPRLLMPGIGRQGGDIRAAFKAAQGNPCYAIIGSAIHRASDMKGAAATFGQEALGFG